MSSRHSSKNQSSRSKVPSSGSQVPPSGSQVPPSGSQVPPSGSQVPSSGSRSQTQTIPSQSLVPVPTSAQAGQVPVSGTQSQATSRSRSQSQATSRASGVQQTTARSQLPASSQQVVTSSGPGKSSVQVRRPRAIIFDILGTASKSGFLEKILFPFLRTNLDNFIATHWSKREFIQMYQRIVEQSQEFNRQEPTTPVVANHEAPEAKQSLMNFLNFVTDNNINSPAVTNLRFKVWFEGYQQSKLKTPIYSDVPNRMRKWFAEGIKFYVFSNTWTEAQKALLRNTNHGDLTNLISGHYDNDFGLLTDPESWRRLCADIKEQPNDVLFLTKSPPEGQAAMEVGVNVVLVLTHRHNVKAVSHEDRQRFAYVRTLNELYWLEEAPVSQSGRPTSSRNLSGSSAAKE